VNESPKSPLPRPKPTGETGTESAEIAAVCGLDPALADLWGRLGDPPPWRRPATFATLVRIILEQQVSLASGKATFDRLRRRCNGTINAKRIGELTPQELRGCGFSRQKARYVSALADDVTSRRFSVAALSRMNDEEARAAIVGRLGLGVWSADIFLLMALRRPDVLPTGDLGLIKGLEELDGQPYSSEVEIRERAESWRPYRSSATRLIWSLYLHNRNRLSPHL